MTRAQITKRVGWTAAVLAVAVLTLTAQAGPKGKGQRGQQSRQQHAQKESGHHRQSSARARSQRVEKRAQKQQTQKRQSSNRTTAVRAASQDRGANWGLNAQRNHLQDRQRQTRRQEQRVGQKIKTQRQELRVRNQRFNQKVSVQRQELRQREHKLDHRASTLKHKTRRYTHTTRHYQPVSRVVYYGGHRSRHDNHSLFGFRFSFGSHDSFSFHYENGHRRYNCCSGGYYITKWVPPLRVTRYDYDGYPYTVIIRDGYYTQVWIPHHCRLGRHHYSRY